MKETIALVVLFITFGCSASSDFDDHSNTSSDLGNDEPLAVFETYWERSKQGDSAGIAELTAAPPDRLYLCESISRAQCETKLQMISEQNQKLRSNANIKQLSVVHDEAFVEEFSPRAIRTGTWQQYSIIRNDLADNEARIRVTISTPGEYVRDILLFRFESGWKIIGVVDPGDYDSLAAR